MGDAVVVLVTFTRPRNLRGYRGRFGLPYPVLSDEGRAAYRAYGLRRGPWWRVWGISTLREYARLLRGGARLQRPTEDISQLGGDFVVDREGRLAYAYRSKGPSDRPPVEELVEAVRRL
jgi:peroxiredoxin